MAVYGRNNDPKQKKGSAKKEMKKYSGAQITDKERESYEKTQEDKFERGRRSEIVTGSN